MLVKDLKKKLEKLDPNLPVVDSWFTIGKEVGFGYSNPNKTKLIYLKKVRGKQIYHLAKKTDKGAFQAVHFFS